MKIVIWCMCVLLILVLIIWGVNAITTRFMVYFYTPILVGYQVGFCMDLTRVYLALQDEQREKAIAMLVESMKKYQHDVALMVPREQWAAEWIWALDKANIIVEEYENRLNLKDIEPILEVPNGP